MVFQDILQAQYGRNNRITMGILIKPLVTEKMTIQAKKLNRYGFEVGPPCQ